MTTTSDTITVPDVLRHGRPTMTSSLRAWLPSVIAALAIALLVVGQSTLPRALGAGAGVVSLAWVMWMKRNPLRRPRLGGLLATYVSTRLLLLVVLGLAAAVRSPQSVGWAWVGIGIAISLVAAEPTLRSLIGREREVIAQLPGVGSVAKQPFAGARLTVASFGVLVLGALLVGLGVHGVVLLVLAILPVPGFVVLGWWALRADARSAMIRARIRPALEAYEPEFVVYYAATSGVKYQLGMWLPYLERLGRPYIVITRNAATVKAITELTKVPVLVPRDLATGGLEQMVVPSLRAAYYVQGSPANQTFQRYRRLTHIWLNHGDSDKEANFHPRHATYDRLFLSGQLGIDRYAKHGIEVAPQKFTLVGRPQIERIEPVDLAATASRSRVLYAPTWQGGRPSTSYSSLQVGPQIIAELLRRELTVIFRPHPLSRTIAADRVRVEEIEELLAGDAARSGRTHVWGPDAETRWDVPDCFNASDALITDVSSLASDYLASGKPFAMVAITASGEQFREEFATARVAYVIEKDLSTLTTALDDLLGDDPLRAQREVYRTYCLGERLGDHAAEGFIEASLDILDSPERADVVESDED